MLNKLLTLNLKMIYFFLKMLPTNKNKILFMSREADMPSLDFELLTKELSSKNKYDIVVLSKRLNKGFKNYIKYYFHLYKEMYHLATAKVCIIDTYIIPVSVLKHKRSLTIIQLWHSMAAIKMFGYQTIGKTDGRDTKVAHSMSMHKNYDYIVSGSKEMIKYFSKAFGYPEENFIVNGEPKVDYLLKNRKKIRSKIYKKYPELRNKKNILYVPTFRKNRPVELNELTDSLNTTNNNLIIKLHPVTMRKVKLSNVLTCDEFTSQELLSIADYIITDYSAISLEAAALDIPIILYLYDYEEYTKTNGLNIDLFKEFGKFACKDAKEVKEALKRKYDKKVVDNFKNKYLDPDFENYTKKLTDFIASKME